MMLGLIQPKRKLWVSDTFTRADSILTPGSAETGQVWTPVSGTWGISGNKLYCVTDVQDDLITIPMEVGNGVIKYDLVGDFVDATHFRSNDLVLRYIDPNNFLLVDLANNLIGIYKKETGFTLLASAPFALASNVTYAIKCTVNVNSIVVNFNGVDKVSYTLAGADATKFHPGLSTVGLRHISQNGVVAATVDNFSVTAA